ncbi:unnamed protein product, partial [Ranitomeya imitator]
MAGDDPGVTEVDQEKYDADENVKIICLGDSAVGKSNRPQQLSTFALTLYKYTTTVDDKTILVDFWDTAGQERFQSMHASYYHKAHACIMVFDVQRKVTYKNLSNWYQELREYRPEIPCIVVANKIDADHRVTQKGFNFAKKHSLPFYFVSAADGTNVVKLFSDAIRLAVSYKQNSRDFLDEVMRELENFELEKPEDASDKEEISEGTESPKTGEKSAPRAANKKKCPVCSAKFPLNWDKKLCQPGTDRIVKAEQPSLLDEIRSLVKQEVQSSLAAFTPPPPPPPPHSPAKNRKIQVIESDSDSFILHLWAGKIQYRLKL